MGNKKPVGQYEIDNSKLKVTSCIVDGNDIVTGNSVNFLNGGRLDTVSTHGLGLVSDNTTINKKGVITTEQPISTLSFTFIASVVPYYIDGNNIFYQKSLSDTNYYEFCVWVDNTGYLSGNVNCLSFNIGGDVVGNSQRIETESNSIKLNTVNNIVIRGYNNVVDVFVNGKKQTLTTTGTIPTFTTSKITNLLGIATLEDFRGGVLLTAESDQVLSDAQCLDLSVDPHQILKPVRTVANDGWYAELFSGGSSQLDIIATPDNLILTESNTNINVSINTQIDVIPQSLTLTEQLSTVYLGNNTSIQAIPSSLLLTESSANVVTLMDTRVDVIPQGMSLLDSVATITIDNSTYVVAIPSNLVLTESDADITSIVNTIVEALPDNLSLTGSDASVSITLPVTLESLSAQIEALEVFVVEMWKLMGLDVNNPTTTTQTTVDVDGIHQDITGDGTTTSTITRTS